MIRAILRAATAAAILAGAVSLAPAQEYPTRPIVVVVPFAAGGPSDTLARLLGQSMSQTLGQQIIVENTAGAGSTVGIGRVAKSAPDGYTLLLSHVSHASTATLYRNLAYDPIADFQPIGMATDGAFVLVTRKDFPANDLKGLLDTIKAEKDKISYAHAGVGSGSHLCGMLLSKELGVTVTQVPYRGTGPALNDIVASKVDVLCDQITSALPQIQGGGVKAFAVTTNEKVEALKTLPYIGFEVGVWHGLYAPKGTPKPVVDKLNAALNTALKDPNVLKRLADLSTTPATPQQATPEYLARHLAGEVNRWRDIIKAAGVYAD